MRSVSTVISLRLLGVTGSSRFLFISSNSRASASFCAAQLMDDDAEADGEVMSILSCEGDVRERTRDAFGTTVFRKHRVVVKLEHAKINSFANANVQTASQFHSKACHTIFDGEVELRKEVEGLPLPVCIPRHANERMSKRLEPRSLGVVLHLHPAEEIVKTFFVANSLRDAGRRELIHKRFTLEMAREVAFDTDIF